MLKNNCKSANLRELSPSDLPTHVTEPNDLREYLIPEFQSRDLEFFIAHINEDDIFTRTEW